MVRRLGLVEYGETVAAMRAFTEARTAVTPDEFWLLEHPPVYTLGLKLNRQNRRPPNSIPVVPTDRGGDITYHGPGQPVVYVLVDLARRGLAIHALVRALEQAAIDLLGDYGVRGERRAGAPGVYVDGAKIAALGLRVRRGASYHGLAFNARMDLSPFRAIDPCGYRGLAVTRLADLAPDIEAGAVGEALLRHVLRALGYTESQPTGLPACSS